MRNTLLEMVQSILSDMDSENVNSISDSVEAQQVASVIEDTFFNIIAAHLIHVLSSFFELKPKYLLETLVYYKTHNHQSQLQPTL